MPRPRLKAYARQLGAEQITLMRDAGVEITLADPDGQVLALLDLLDGTPVLDIKPWFADSDVPPATRSSGPTTAG